jgi:hypothetical protein
MKPIRESIGFTPKIFASNMFFTDKNSQNVKKNNKFFPSVTRRAAAAAVNNFFLHAYSLDHKT